MRTLPRIFYDSYRDNLVLDRSLVQELSHILARVLGVSPSQVASAIVIHELLHRKLRTFSRHVASLYADVETCFAFIGTVLGELEHKLIVDLLCDRLKQIEQMLYRLWLSQTDFERLSLPQLLVSIVRLAVALCIGAVTFEDVPRVFRHREFYKLVHLVHMFRKSSDIKQLQLILTDIVAIASRIASHVFKRRRGEKSVKVSCGTSSHQSSSLAPIITQ